MTTRIWYENDAIQMDGVGAIPARSLYTVLDGDRVHVLSQSGFRLAQLVYGQYAKKDGSTFASPAAAKTYLDGEFAKYDPGSWGALTGKPATFPPGAHTHLWADITDRPTIPAPTPLGSATPQPLGTAAAGSSANAAREDHVHPRPAGLMTFVGTATIGETLLVGLSLGVKRYTGAMQGLAVGDRVMAFLTGSPGSSSLQDIYVSAANTYNVGLLNPALGIGSVIAVPIAVYKVV